MIRNTFGELKLFKDKDGNLLNRELICKRMGVFSSATNYDLPICTFLNKK